MSKEIYISSTPHETRLAIVENDALAEIYYERENEYTLAGSIYNGKVTRVLPGMQSSFVDIGLERDAFLYITDFMEEAGDSADFEASANAGDAGHAPRANGDRGGRSSRNEQPKIAPEPTDADLFAQAVSGLEPARPAVIEGERAERGDRGRRGGRNRGNRGGNRPEAPRPEVTQGEEIVADRSEPVAGNISIPDSQEEIGEGLPGADGSRRWRGRRGRRGNRGPGATGVAPAEAAAAEPVRPSTTGPVYDAYGSDEPVAAQIEAASETLPTDSEQAAFQERSQRAPRNERHERGERNDRGERNNRAERNGRNDRGPRAPREFAPSTDLAKVESESRYGQEAETEAPIEPVILPGESLSKYRAGNESPALTVTPAPAVDTFVAEGWDGGFVLPGETLRPRTAPPAFRNDAPREDRGRGDRGGRDRNRGREERSDRSTRPAASRAEAAPTPYPAALTEPASLPEPGQVPASSLPEPINSTFVPPPPMPVETEPVASHEVVSEPIESHEGHEDLAAMQDYEPSEGSAFYRVDPVPPSEFRQPAPVLDAPYVAGSAEVSQNLTEQPILSEEPTEDEETTPELQPESFDEPAHAEEFVQAVDLPAGLAQHGFDHEMPVESHDMTSISATGDMHSEPAAAGDHDLPAYEAAAPTTPIAHGGAVVSLAEMDALHVDSSPVEAMPVHAGHAVLHTSPMPTFEPGSGLLEEEELLEDEDDTVVSHLHAHTAAEFEQQEHETLENAADLGVMLREMSIDSITRAEPALEEDVDEDDFEEDFLEEDQDFQPEESEPENELDESGDEAAYAESDHEQPSEAAITQPQGEGAPSDAQREPRRERSDRGRREGRGRDRNRRPERSGSSSSSSSNGDHRREGGRGRQSMQSTNLPAISDLLKPGQEILVQIAKEPIAKKGARITSHIALPGRFLVFMPTVSHTGVSRKIESDGERRRLKEILLSEKGDAQGGFIVRTAAAGASEDELRSDLRFLLNLWSDIKTRSESSKSPALIYHDLNLIERVLRDQVTDTFSAIWVDSETEYERVLRFLQRFQPSLIRRVKLYSKETPLFEQFGITEEINKALRSKVWLKSGGSIVINQTEALVAIDINTGKFVGKTARLEDTIVKTNLDAIPEIVRQIRLRDLGGIIIIDFIDMDERKNRNKVMAALEEELKSDRAPSKVLQFNDFGLVAITRKRVKQSLERTLSTTCGVCAGTGMVKSPVTVCNDIYVEMRKMAKHLDRGDVMLRVHPEVVKQLKAPSTHWLQEMEEMVGKTILVKSDPSLHPEQFDIH